MSENEDGHCEICRAPHAAIPCSRCALPPPVAPNRPRKDGSARPAEPIKLEGKYHLLEELGRGGMGTVFRAVDETLERDVAVKFLLPEIQALEDAVELFRREARAMASINHRNVVRVYSFGRYGEADFIVTEFIDGPTVEQMIDAAYSRHTFLDGRQAMSILVQASAGLAAIHVAGVVHRDIKPGNVMVEADSERALIMDFGIGRRIDLEKGTTASPRGTPAYMAPEIIRQSEIEPSAERLVDIYAFGITAFELLTNRLPFDGETWLDIFEKHLDHGPPRLEDAREDVPPGLEEVIARCIEKDPGARYQSADELRGALASIARRLGIDG